jgi:hypothetical protein
MDVLSGVPGSRANSRNHTVEQAESSQHDRTLYEALVTNLFVPWLVEEVPDPAWTTLQEKLGLLIREMLSGKSSLKGGNNDKK